MRRDSVLCAIVEKKFFKRTKLFLKNHIVTLPAKLCVWFIAKTTPVQENKIIFITTRGQYDCNPKWIAEELHNRNLGYAIVWTVRTGLVENAPRDFIHTVRGSYDFYRHISGAKIIVDNSVNMTYLGYKKKKNQILVETWHGSIGIKMFSKETNKDEDWCRKATWEGAMTDYCLSNSAFEDNVFRDTFWSNAQILQLGHARNDVLCWHDPQRLEPIRRKVFEYFHLDSIIREFKRQRHDTLTRWYQEKTGQIPVTAEHLGKRNPFDDFPSLDPDTLRAFMETEYAKCEDVRICLYAPTFRDDGDMRPYEIDYEQLRQALHARFGGCWVIMTRFHFRLRKKLKNLHMPSTVINASEYPDIQELLVCTDVGITDYSSWICDYMLTRRPGFLFATDMEQYKKKDREFFYPLTSMPFPLALNNEQLIQNILEFDSSAFPAKCDAFLKEKGCMDDGHAAERIADFMESILKGEDI